MARPDRRTTLPKTQATFPPASRQARILSTQAAASGGRSCPPVERRVLATSWTECSISGAPMLVGFVELLKVLRHPENSPTAIAGCGSCSGLSSSLKRGRKNSRSSSGIHLPNVRRNTCRVGQAPQGKIWQPRQASGTLLEHHETDAHPSGHDLPVYVFQNDGGQLRPAHKPGKKLLQGRAAKIDGMAAAMNGALLPGCCRPG